MNLYSSVSQSLAKKIFPNGSQSLTRFQLNPRHLHMRDLSPGAGGGYFLLSLRTRKRKHAICRLEPLGTRIEMDMQLCMFRDSRRSYSLIDRFECHVVEKGDTTNDLVRKL